MTERLSRRIELAVVAAAVVVGIAHRLLFGWSAPLWLDESYTAVIASERDVADLIAWCRQELSGPVYYSSMWVWEKVAGNGNLALRLPSLIASLAAILLVAIRGPVSGRERLLWAALIAVWLPGLLVVAQARPQALLFLLACGQAMAFLRFARGGSRRWLTLWAALGAAMVLTHLHAAVITGIQFALILLLHRPAPAKLWPSLAIFAVAAAWLPLQLPFVLGILKPGRAWYPALAPGDLVKVPIYLFGANLAAFLVVGIVVAILIPQFAARRSSGTPMPYDRAEAGLALSALASIAIVVTAGFFRPSFEPRYLLPYMPALLFGLTIVLARTRALLGLLPGIVLLAWAGPAVENMIWFKSADAQQLLNPLEFERGSAWLMQRGSRRVIFIWDNPTSALSGPVRQAEIGGFFFRRAGYPVELQAIYLPHDDQPPGKLAALSAANDADLLWIGGERHPAGLLEMPQFECREFGIVSSRSMACRRTREPRAGSSAGPGGPVRR